MFTISRVTSPQVAQSLLSHVTLDDGTPPEVFGHQLVEMLTHHPDSVCVIVARSDAGVVGFVVLQNTPSDYTFVVQAWSLSTNPRSVADAMFARAVLWTNALGKSKIRAQTSRDVDSFYRRFGFAPVASIIEHTIDPSITQRLIDALKEPSDGQPVQ